MTRHKVVIDGTPIIGQKYVALYCRISEDKSGRVEGVKAQEKWGRAYAAQHWPGLPVVVFSDNDLSAAKDDVFRPEYEKLREAIRNGEVAYVWCKEQTRIERSDRWFRLAVEMDAAGISQLHTDRDGIVNVMDEVAGIKAVLAMSEVRRLRRRTMETLEVKAAEGRPSGGSLFGYRPALDETGGRTLAIYSPEALIIRECAERILAGWSLHRIAADLDERGVRGARGGRILTTSIRQLTMNYAVAGLRIHHGRVVPAVWPAILERDVWDAVRDRLTGPRTVETRAGRDYPISGQRHTPARVYLLSTGLGRCGVCGAKLSGGMKMFAHGVRRPYYTCHVNSGGKGCVGTLSEPMEAVVVAALLDELAKPEFVAALTADEHAARRDELTAALRALDVRRSDLAREWGRGDLASDEWQAAKVGMAEREHELRVALAAVPPPVSTFDPQAARAGWPDLNLDERRHVIALTMEAVVLHPGRRGAQGFDPRRVEILMRYR